MVVVTPKEYYNFKYRLESVEDMIRNATLYQQDHETLLKLQDENYKLRKEINNKNRSRYEDYEVALYIVLRTDRDIWSNSTIGEYMDFVAESMKIGAFQAGHRAIDWVSSGYNRIILSADGAKEIVNLITFANKNNVPYKPLYRKLPRKKLKKQKALVGVALGPYYRNIVSKATDRLFLF